MPSQPRLRSAGDGAPLIVRVGGLSVDSMGGFASDLPAAVKDADALQTRLVSARAETMERLHGAIPGAPTELRPFLLAVKRDCHNARPLHRRTRDTRWSALRERVGAAADHVVELEAAAAEWNARFEADFAEVVERQRAFLLDTAGDPAFSRGLALASPDLSSAMMERHAAPGEKGGRKERKIETALLRYVTRAATKLSPFSTLTPVGLGVIRDDPTLRGVRLVDQPWRSTSLVRLSRYLPDRVVDLLRHYPPFRARLRVELNDSLSEIRPGRFLLLRPRRWEVDTGKREIGFEPEAMVAVEVHGPLLEYLARVLRSGPCTHEGLIGAMERDLGSSGEGVREQVDRLVGLGVLQLISPWPTHATRLERRLLDHLRTLPREHRLDVLVEHLDRLARLQDGYATASEPVRVIQAIRELIPEVIGTAVELAGLEPAAIEALATTTSNVVSEDVFLHAERPVGRGVGAAVAEVPRAAMEAALRSAGLLVRLSVLFEDRLELQHTLAAVARERWPGRGEVGLLESLRDVQPLWQEYTKFHFEGQKGARTEPRTWNPLGLPELEELHRSRMRVYASLPDCARTVDQEERFCPDAIEALLGSSPDRFTDADPWGAMLLFQPASADGSLWVLNQFKEGTGRYGSRYTSAMDEPTRDWYTAHLAARSSYRIGGEDAELLDVLCVQGSTLNVHDPQTPRVLVTPGDATDLPASRRLRLRDVRISFDGPGGLPRLRGPDDERLLPVNLGFAFESHMPMLLRYLCAFGPSELWGVLPRRSSRRRGAVTVSDRTVLGNLVVHRRRWSIPAGRLREALEGAGDAQAFAAVNRIRSECGIPERVFFRDRIPSSRGRPVEKPQYLDFTSPLFLPLLRSALKGREEFAVTEMLPEPGMCPADAAGRRWMVELMLDSLSVRAPSPAQAPVPAELYRAGAMRPNPRPTVQAASRAVPAHHSGAFR